MTFMWQFISLQTKLILAKRDKRIKELLGETLLPTCAAFPRWNDPYFVNNTIDCIEALKAQYSRDTCLTNVTKIKTLFALLYLGGVLHSSQQNLDNLCVTDFESFRLYVNIISKIDFTNGIQWHELLS